MGWEEIFSYAWNKIFKISLNIVKNVYFFLKDDSFLDEGVENAGRILNYEKDQLMLQTLLRS